MAVYIILLFILFMLRWANKSGRLSDDGFCIISCILFICITGLRHPDVGSDTSNYYNMMEELPNLSLHEAIAESRDYGFFTFAWLLMKIGGSFTLVTLVAASTFYIPLCLFIRRYSSDYCLSFISLMAFNFFQFSMTGMRQTMAFGFVLLFFMELYERKKRIVRLVLYFVIGITLHTSAVLMLIYLPLTQIKNTNSNASLWLILIPIFFFFRSQITLLIMPFLSDAGFTIGEEMGGGITSLFVYFALMVYGFFLHRRNSAITSFDLIIMILVVSMQCLVLTQSVFFRGVWYLSIYLSIYVPKLIASCSKSSRGLVRTGFYMGLLYMYIFITIGSANVTPYRFFWQ